MQAVTDRRGALAQRHAEDRDELVAGLLARPARIAPKYFYDALGCALYAAICQTREYYPTRTEAAIFARHAAAIARRVGCGGTLVDLGCGDGAKALAWIPSWQPDTYVGVDFAAEVLVGTLDRIAAAFPALDVRGVAVDFTRGLDLRADLPDAATTFFYPGSSIGNFVPDEALALIRAIRAHRGGGRDAGLLIGVDTHKDAQRLVAAYDDATGVTAAFNRNVLNHVNALLGTTFDPAAFSHVASYDGAARCIRMHLEARCTVEVTIDGVQRRYDAGERIHTEDSYKYAPDDFEALLRRAGFRTVERWSDPAGDFALFHAV